MTNFDYESSLRDFIRALHVPYQQLTADGRLGVIEAFIASMPVRGTEVERLWSVAMEAERRELEAGA